MLCIFILLGVILFFFHPFFFFLKAPICWLSYPLVAFCSCFVKVMFFLFYLRIPVSWNIFPNHFQRYILLRDDVPIPQFAVFLKGLLFSVCPWARWALSRFVVCHKQGEWVTMGTVLCALGGCQVPFSDLVSEGLVHIHCSSCISSD